MPVVNTCFQATSMFCNSVMLKLVHTTFKNTKNSVRNLHIVPNFTKENYKISRGAYNVLTSDHILHFHQQLGGNRVITDKDSLEKYNVDWFKLFRGASAVVLKPKTTNEVAEIFKYCNSNLLAVCLQAGKTSLVGGSVPVFDEVIISSELMDTITEFDPKSGIVVCQAGCILENLDNHVATAGLMVPLDLGAKGSCHIGGNVATNAGGKRVLKYGNLHGNVVGLEVVKADGSILDMLNTLKKNNTGLHLKNLFIGSEGTLGFITKVALQCPSRPKCVHVAFLGCDSYSKIILTLQKAKQSLSEILSAFEVMDNEGVRLLSELMNIHSPIGDYPYYILVETSGSNQEHDEAKILYFLNSILEENIVLNGTMVSEDTKINALWTLRESLSTASRKDGYSFAYDVTLPLQYYFQLVDETRAHVGELAKSVTGYGHLGDGNLHLVVKVPEFNPEVKEIVESFVINRVIEMNGSISSEHGLGFQKAHYLEKVNSKGSYQLMKDIKRKLDPNNILNPYKVFV